MKSVLRRWNKGTERGSIHNRVVDQEQNLEGHHTSRYERKKNRHYI